jgi:hypothetical protein
VAFVADHFDPMLPVIVPAGSLLTDAVSALGTAPAAMARRVGLLAPPWQIIVMIGQFEHGVGPARWH